MGTTVVVYVIVRKGGKDPNVTYRWPNVNYLAVQITDVASKVTAIVSEAGKDCTASKVNITIHCVKLSFLCQIT